MLWICVIWKIDGLLTTGLIYCILEKHNIATIPIMTLYCYFGLTSFNGYWTCSFKISFSINRIRFNFDKYIVIVHQWVTSYCCNTNRFNNNQWVYFFLFLGIFFLFSRAEIRHNGKSFYSIVFLKETIIMKCEVILTLN